MNLIVCNGPLFCFGLRAYFGIWMRYFYGFCFLVGSFSIYGQHSYQVGDFNLEDNEPYVNNVISDFVRLGDKFLFKAFDNFHQYGLWVSDGTPQGTHLLLDLFLDPTSYYPLHHLTVCGNRIFFFAVTPEYGPQIWVTDGTPQGTNPVIPGHTWSENAYARNLLALNDQFITIDFWDKVWITDGTPAGTRVIYQGAVYDFIVSNGTLFFRPNADELWSYLTTTDELVLINDETPGDIFDNGTDLYFTTYSDDHELNIWRTDGTQEGTHLFKTFDPMTYNRPLTFFPSIGEITLFQFYNEQFGNELFRTDGTEIGTFHIKDINPGQDSTRIILPETMALNGVLYFAASDANEGTELWKSDGTEAGTIQVTDLYPGEGSSKPRYLTPLGQRFCFFAFNSDNSSAIYISDGTHQGTEVLQDLPYATLAYPSIYPLGQGAVEVDGTLFFGNFDETEGWDLWQTDGTASGTQLLKDIYSGPLGSSDSPYMWAENGYLYFSPELGEAADGFYMTNGEPNQWSLLQEAEMRGKATVNNQHFFEGTDFNIYQTDGSLQGTNAIFFNTFNLIPFNQNLYFFTGSGLHRSYLDPLEAELIVNFPREIGRAQRYAPGIASPSQLFFFLIPYPGTSLSNPVTLFAMNQLEQIENLGIVQTGHREDQFCVGLIDQGLFLNYQAYNTGHELGFSDGTPSGTSLLKDIYAGNESSFPKEFHIHNGILYFEADDGIHGRELWRSDGTEAGTLLIKDISTGSASAGISSMVPYNGELFFVSNDGVHGTEIWKTDGSESGTSLVYDLAPGPVGSYPNFMTVFQNKLFFAASDKDNGFELWSIQGTSSPELVEDLNPGPYSSFPQHLIAVDQTLFYYAYGDATGIELRALRTMPISGFQVPPMFCSGGMQRQATAMEFHPNAAYTWRLTGADIASGQGTRTLAFDITASGTVLIELDTWLEDQMITSSQAIPVIFAAPDPPSDIFGEMLVCAGDSGITYDVLPVFNAAYYHWDIPADACIVQGQGTNSITVSFGSSLGTITVNASNDCGQSTTAMLPIAFYLQDDPANAGLDQFICGAQTVLEGNPVSPGSGMWTIVSGDGGTLTDPQLPHTTFSGIEGVTYVLEWLVDNSPCSSSSSLVTISFLPIPETANAGPDQSLCELNTQLSANQPDLTQGRWEIVNGLGGYISQLSDPNALFTGQHGQTYQLRWHLWADPCANTSDDVIISMHDLIISDAGSDLCGLLGEPIELSASGEPGSWSILSGPDLSISQLSDPMNPLSTFIASGGSGSYELQWQTQPNSCSTQSDSVIINVVPSVFTNFTMIDDSLTPQDQDAGPRSISNLWVFDGHAYFSAEGDFSGTELWRTDGTAAGTGLVKDLNLNLDGTFNPASSEPQFILSSNDFHYFKITTENKSFLISFQPQNGVFHIISPTGTYPVMILPLNDGVILTFPEDTTKLWKSDGTSSGTTDLLILHGGSGTPSVPVSIGQLDQWSIFCYHRELWRTDGSISGTTVVKNISLNDSASNVRIGNQLFFTSDTGLLVTDGTEEGTISLVYSEIGPLWVMGNRVFFSASNELGQELWHSDGSPEGTQVVKDLVVGGEDSSPEILAVYDNQLIFTAQSGESRILFKTDGTSQGTASILNQSFDLAISFQGQLLLAGGTPSGLWKSDGTSQGTEFVSSEKPLNFADLGSILVFKSENEILFTTDGSTSGTLPVIADTHVANYPEYWKSWQTLGEQVLIVNTSNGIELMRSDGTVEGTLSLHTFTGEVILNPEIDGSILFDHGGDEIWETDGTSSGTQRIVDLSTLFFSSIEHIHRVNGVLYFNAKKSYSSTLWRSEGTLETTEQITAFTSSSLEEIILFQNHLYLTTRDSSGPLWVSDGSNQGTQVCLPGTLIRYPKELTVNQSGTAFYFSARSSTTSKNSFFVTDGTEEGTVELTGSGVAFGLTMLGDVCFCGMAGTEIWRSDGTVEGTFPVLQGLSRIGTLEAGSDGLLYASMTDTKDNDQLWVSDGTAIGTSLLYDSVSPQGFPGIISDICSVGETVYCVSTFEDQGFQVLGFQNGCQWIAGQPHSDFFITLDMIPTPSQMFLLARDKSSAHRLSVYRPPIPMMEDMNFRHHLVQEYDTNRDTVIDEREMLLIHQLDIANQGIRDLSGIEHIRTLNSLDASHNQIKDLSPLLNYPENGFRLSYIDITHNLLTEDDCELLGKLNFQIKQQNGVLKYASQGDILYTPQWMEWPVFSVVNLINGVFIPEYTLGCGR